MNPNKKKEKSKLNGKLGNFRFGVSIFLISIVYIFFILIFKNSIIALVAFIFMFIIASFIKIIVSRQVNIRPLTIEEWDKYSMRNVIHYRNDIIEMGEKIYMNAHFSERTNYSLPKEFRKKGFIWFHLSEFDRGAEPILNSFLYAHFNEGTPRKYKIIYPLNLLDRKKTYIDPKTKYILLESDLIISERYEKIFCWYNKKVYWDLYFLV